MTTKTKIVIRKSTSPPASGNISNSVVQLLGGRFCYLEERMPNKVEYNKPAKSIDELIDLLEKRGLYIGDKGKAKHFLSMVNYYRLSGYWFNYQRKASAETRYPTAGLSEDQKEDYDYHFMREDSHNSWSHKFRDEYPKRTDFKGKKIIDPRIADIGVLFSFHEQCSFSAIEMMMFDLPVISTDSTGLKEMFPEKYRCSVHYCNSKSYLLIEECVDKIIQLLTNKNNDSMRVLYLNNYILNKMGEKMKLLYREL